MVEIKILKAMMYQSKVVAPGEVIALGKADAAYCVSIGRAEFIEAAKPKKAAKAKDATE